MISVSRIPTSIWISIWIWGGGVNELIPAFPSVRILHGQSARRSCASCKSASILPRRLLSRQAESLSKSSTIFVSRIPASIWISIWISISIWIWGGGVNFITPYLEESGELIGLIDTKKLVQYPG